jgi:hypothetical protein
VGKPGYAGCPFRPKGEMDGLVIVLIEPSGRKNTVKIINRKDKRIKSPAFGAPLLRDLILQRNLSE